MAMTALLVALSVVGAAALVLVVREFKNRISARATAGFRDGLTGLPARAVMEERLGKVLSRAQRNGYTVAVLVVSIDRVQLVNDSLGHDQGTVLLRAVAERLQRC